MANSYEHEEEGEGEGEEGGRTEGNGGGVKKGKKHWLLVGMSVIALVVGQSAATILSRFYFTQGGQSRWLRSLLLSIGWPLLFLPVLLNPQRKSALQTFISAKYVLACGILGVLSAANSMLYSIGVSFLPVSTFSLLCATVLAFNTLFSFVLVKRRISPYVLNSIVLLTFSAVLLAIQSKSERPAGVKKSHFVLGFVCTVLASASYGLVLTLLQIVFRKVARKENFTVVLVSQALVYMVAALICTVGLLSSGDFRYLVSESQRFRSGKIAYYMTLVWCAVAGQMFSLGMFGLIFLVSSLFSNVVSAVTLPVVPILAVFLFQEKLDAVKIMAMFLGLWGFISYVFGGYRYSKDAAPGSRATTSEL